MIKLEKHIASLVESQFPAFYKEEGNNFISFVKAYYEWLESLVIVCELDNSQGFNEGDTVTQNNSEGIASGTIIYKKNNTVFVQTNTDNIFRCKLYCQEIVPIVSSSGASTYIATTSSPNALYHSRKLFDYRELDTTLSKFIIHFKEKYLSNIQFTTKSNKKLLIKKAQDLYRSKGSPRAVELFFRLVYGVDASVYIPGQDIFKLSDGEWVKPVYLEVSREENNINYVGKQIYGLASGATAFVDRLIRRKIKSTFVDLFYLSNVTKNFTLGEFILLEGASTSVSGAPTAIGSLTTLEVLQGASDYQVGDVVDVESDTGAQGKARVTSVQNSTGIVNFDLVDGGFGYSTSANVFVSEKVLQLSNVSVTNTSFTRPFGLFETVSQQVANIYTQGILSLNIISNNGAFSANDVVYQQLSGSNTFIARVLAANTSVIKVKYPNTGSFSTSLTLLNANASSNALISSATVDSVIPVGSNVTSYYSNGVVSGRGVVDNLFTNSTPYAYTVRVAVSSGKLADTTNTAYSDLLYFGNTSAPNTYVHTVNTHSFVNATATVTGVSSVVTLYTSDLSGTLAVNDKVTQGNTANGTVTRISSDGSNAYITVSNTQGIFSTGTRITGAPSGASANVRAFSISVGVHNINNTFTNVGSQVVTGSLTSPTTGKLVLISKGSGADFSIGSLDNEEQVSLATDYLKANNVSGNPYMGISLNAAQYGFPKQPSGNVSTTLYDVLTFFNGNIGSVATLTNINPGVGYDLDPLVLVFDSISAGFDKKDVRIEYIKTSSSSFLTGEIVTQESPVANGFVLNVSNTTASFAPNMLVYQSNGSANIATGYVVTSSIASNSGTVTLRNVSGTFQPTVGANGVARAYINSTATANAKILTTAATTVGLKTKGQIKEANNSHLVVKYLTVQNTFEVNNAVVGTSSGATGNITGVTVLTSSLAAGFNANVSANVVTATGVVTGLEVVDSGYGFTQEDVVSFKSANGTVGTAKAELLKEGRSEGYYNSTKGFLSQDKYIFDGNYYQEYSYEILSRLPFETYESVFRDVMHIAGTSLYGSVVLESAVNSTITAYNDANDVYDFTYSSISNTEVFTSNTLVYQSNGTANVFTGYVNNNPEAVITLSSAANTKLQVGRILYQPNTTAPAATGYVSGVESNTSANTLTVFLSNVSGTFTNTANVVGTTNTTISYTGFIRVLLTSITSPNTFTGSFTVGENVTQNGGFTGNVVSAVRNVALLQSVSGTFTANSVLTGSTSGCKGLPVSSTSTSPTVGSALYQEVNRLSLVNVSGTFTNGELVYQNKQSSSSSNTLSFVNTAIARVVSSNSTSLTIENEIGGVIPGYVIYGSTSNAYANVVGRNIISTAKATVLGANSSTANVINIYGTLTNTRHIYSNSFVANTISSTDVITTVQSANIVSAINKLRIVNTVGEPDPAYSLLNNTGHSATIVEINLDDN